MSESSGKPSYRSAREKFLGLSLESTRKSYYPQLKEQLEAAKDKERRLQLLIDSLPARIAYVGAGYRYLLVNREYERLFGLQRSAIIGRPVLDIIGAKNFDRLKGHADKVLAGQEVHFESEFDLADGSVQIHEISFVPVYDGQGQVDGFYVLAIDVTGKRRAAEQTKKLEAKLHDAQKFKAIGTLAGGIAHDFNNLLMGIQGRASLLALHLDPSHPLMEHVAAIEEYIRSATDLTRQLLGFARGGKYQVKPVELNDLVLSSATMFGRTRKQIRMHFQLWEKRLVGEIDRTQIEQVLLNLFVNAWQAMPDGGDLYLETRPVALDEEYCRPHDVKPGNYARISVTDTGIGMTEATRFRVFDPFFTTKEKQRGTGLGLASAYGIVKNHGGIITVYSEPGRGATFNVYLPLSDKEEVREVPTAARLHQGSGHILLVDDEQMILDVGKAMLEALGYRVTTASHGEEAVALFARDPAAIDLVILDLVMPGVDGGATFDRIRAVKPDMKVILSSGYSLNGQANSIMQRGCAGFIQKPFTVSELSVIVRRTLEQEGFGQPLPEP